MTPTTDLLPLPASERITYYVTETVRIRNQADSPIMTVEEIVLKRHQGVGRRQLDGVRVFWFVNGIKQQDTFHIKSLYHCDAQGAPILPPGEQKHRAQVKA